jgi:hypothetical protein
MIRDVVTRGFSGQGDGLKYVVTRGYDIAIAVVVSAPIITDALNFAYTHAEAVSFAYTHAEAVSFAYTHAEAVSFAYTQTDAVNFVE